MMRTIASLRILVHTPPGVRHSAVNHLCPLKTVTVKTCERRPCYADLCGSRGAYLEKNSQWHVIALLKGTSGKRKNQPRSTVFAKLGEEMGAAKLYLRPLKGHI
jgi:hypothetical protein